MRLDIPRGNDFKCLQPFTFKCTINLCAPIPVCRLLRCRHLLTSRNWRRFRPLKVSGSIRMFVPDKFKNFSCFTFPIDAGNDPIDVWLKSRTTKYFNLSKKVSGIDVSLVLFHSNRVRSSGHWIASLIVDISFLIKEILRTPWHSWMGSSFNYFPGFNKHEDSLCDSIRAKSCKISCSWQYLTRPSQPTLEISIMHRFISFSI